MKTRFLVLLMTLLSVAIEAKESSSLIHLAEVYSVPFIAQTQMGEIEAVFSVSLLRSEFGPDTSLYLTVRYSEELPAYIDRILPQSHSPVMEIREEKIIILYSSGANTTCITHYDLSDGHPRFIETKAIAWNDQGEWKKSDDFDRFEHLYRMRHNQSREDNSE